MTTNTQSQAVTGPDILTFGETMALLMPSNGKGLEYSSELHSLFGGAESNVAIGIARLGGKVGWFGHLGKDPMGRLIFKKSAEKVSMFPVLN